MKISWKDVLHYATGACAILIGGAAEFGLQIPGVVVSDPKMTVTLGIGIIVAGLKGGVLSGAK